MTPVSRIATPTRNGCGTRGSWRNSVLVIIGSNTGSRGAANGGGRSAGSQPVAGLSISAPHRPQKAPAGTLCRQRGSPGSRLRRWAPLSSRLRPQVTARGATTPSAAMTAAMSVRLAGRSVRPAASRVLPSGSRSAISRPPLSGWHDTRRGAAAVSHAGAKNGPWAKTPSSRECREWAGQPHRHGTLIHHHGQPPQCTDPGCSHPDAAASCCRWIARRSDATAVRVGASGWPGDLTPIGSAACRASSTG